VRHRNEASELSVARSYRLQVREKDVKRILRIIPWLALTTLASANAFLAMRYLLPHVPFAPPLPNLKLHRLALTVHAAFAGVALAIGPFEIVEGLRLRWPPLHRKLGWIYVVSVAIAGSSAIILARQASFGPVAGFGFLTLAIAWLSATGMALKLVIQRRYTGHRRWMLRSYALTAAAITLRLLLPASAVMRLPPGLSYKAAAWLCWLINLGLVEIYLFFGSNTLLPRTTNEEMDQMARSDEFRWSRGH